MAVQNIECQIAQAQLGPYLAGDPLGAEAVRQLEAHFGKCADCKAVLTDRKTALISQIEAAPANKRTPPASGLGRAVVSQVSVSAERPEAQGPSATPALQASKWKPLALSGALALVLLGMSYFGKNGFDLLGPKAETNLAATATTEKVTPATTAESTPATPAPEPNAPFSDLNALELGFGLAALPSLGDVVPESAPAENQRVAVPRRPAQSKRTVRRSPVRHRPKAARSAVRVYDPSGNPINN